MSVLAAARRRTRLAGSGAFQPSQLPGLVLWLEARTLSLNDGALVSTWTALIGDNGTAAGTARPTYKVVGTRPVLRFNGSSTKVGGAVAISGPSLTAFVLATIDSLVLAAARLLSLAATGQSDWGNTGSASAMEKMAGQERFRAYRTVGVSSAPVPFSARTIVTSKFDGTHHTMFANGVAGTPVASSGNFAIARYGVGSQANTTGTWLAGDVEAVVIYNTALSDSDRNSVEAYLATL